MDFPQTRWQILHNYQVELENWVARAPIENIKQYLTSIHGLVYPDDWDDLLNAHISENTDSSINYIQSCSHCQEILSAILTISQTTRPELDEIIKIASNQ